MEDLDELFDELNKIEAELYDKKIVKPSQLGYVDRYDMAKEYDKGEVKICIKN